MKVRIKKSVWSSKFYIPDQRKKVKKLFKRKNSKNFHKYKHKKPKNPYAKKSHRRINMSAKMDFPKHIKKINNFIHDCEKYQNHYKLSMDLRNVSEINNAAILLLTANLDRIFEKKLVKRKAISPKSDIDDRLAAIGFWDVVCVNPPVYDKDSRYLRIIKMNSPRIENNGFHQEIIDFFSEAHNIEYNYKDKLFDAVYEACTNSIEHAYNENEQNKRVWFLGSYDENSRELEFIFYDVGMGIFTSLGKQTSKFKLLLRYLKIFGKDKTLEKLCTTRLSRYKKDPTQTSRGAGMISFKEFIEAISQTREAELEIFTENLLYSTKNGVTKLDSPIVGTLIRWVIGDRYGQNLRV